MAALEALDVLTTWSEIQTKNTERAIQLAIATVLHKLGETSVEITHQDIADMLKEYYPETIRNAFTAVGVKLTRIEDLGEDPRQGAFDLEVTSER